MGYNCQRDKKLSTWHQYVQRKRTGDWKICFDNISLWNLPWLCPKCIVNKSIEPQWLFQQIKYFFHIQQKILAYFQSTGMKAFLLQNVNPKLTFQNIFLRSFLYVRSKLGHDEMLTWPSQYTMTLTLWYKKGQVVLVEWW